MELTRFEKIQALIDGGLADNRIEAIEQLIDMGELDENGESWDDNTSHHGSAQPLEEYGDTSAATYRLV